MRLVSVDQLRENVGIAIDALRVSKMRSALTILGVVIGVATVMTMASIVQGVRDQILDTINIAGPSTFYVMKLFSTTLVDPQMLPKYIRVRPDLTQGDAQRIAELPQVQYASLWTQVLGRLEYAGTRSQATSVFGADDRFQEIQGGELLQGRWFTKSELRSGKAVVVLDDAQSRRLFGRERAIGKTMNVGGRPMEVIGIYTPPLNAFAPPGQETGAIVPFLFAWHAYRIDKLNGLFIPVKPQPGVTARDAEDAVRVALRESRHLRPAEKDNFDLVSQDQLLNTVMSITDIFFLVMIALASVALMVGGIGVMAIMMVSVTARTREIGVRKALGATRRDILLQFLIEAATLTGIGGVLGVLFGVLAGRVVTGLLNVKADFPYEYTAIAVAVSVAIGLVFGVVPARRAARMDPIEALRHE